MLSAETAPKEMALETACASGEQSRPGHRRAPQISCSPGAGNGEPYRANENG
jgi:hypothetical protein